MLIGSFQEKRRVYGVILLGCLLCSFWFHAMNSFIILQSTRAEQKFEEVCARASGACHATTTHCGVQVKSSCGLSCPHSKLVSHCGCESNRPEGLGDKEPWVSNPPCHDSMPNHTAFLFQLKNFTDPAMAEVELSEASLIDSAFVYFYANELMTGHFEIHSPPPEIS